MSDPGHPAPITGDQEVGVAMACAAIAAAVQPLSDTELLPLAQATQRVLAADVVSPIAVPAHDNSAMDGYACHGSALVSGQAAALRCVGSAYAGRPHGGPVATGECVRIMTGAVMPAGLDTVVPQELCSVEADRVQVRAGAVRAGDNRRLRGEDLAPGQTALQAGRQLRPADLGLLASLGIAEVVVFRRLRVALFSTGDELRSPGEPLEAGAVYDSNRASLRAAVQRLGMDVVDLGLVRDDPDALQATLQAAVAQADVVLTSGGVSVGDADHTRALLARLGDVAFWKVAMRPGRPFAFGTLRRPGGGPPCRLFALPGNPVAALVSFYVLAREALLRLAGATPMPLPALQARCLEAVRKRPGRAEYLRAIVEPGADGWQVRLSGPQGSGVLRSMSAANALIVLPEGHGTVAAGEMVDVWLFDGLV